MDNNNGEQNLSWNVYYWYSFTSIQNSKSLAKTGILDAGTSKLIPKKFLTLHSPFCLFFNQLQLNCHPKYFGVYILLLMKSSGTFKMVHSDTKKAKSGVRQSQLCYLRTAHSSVLKLICFETFQQKIREHVIVVLFQKYVCLFAFLFFTIFCIIWFQLRLESILSI